MPAERGDASPVSPGPKAPGAGGESEALARRIVAIADAKGASDFAVLAVGNLVGYTDYLVICTARNERQAKGIHDEVYGRLKKDDRRLEDYTGELWDLSVKPTSASEGLVDFPAMIDGRKVHLCWKLGEPEVLYWHGIDAGFRERQPLAEGSLAGEASQIGRCRGIDR